MRVAALEHDDPRAARRRFPSLAALSLALWVATVATVVSDVKLFRDTTTCDSPHLRNNDDESLVLTKPKFPHVAWLMSWPNSGTSYTLRIVREISNQTTATNYGNEHLNNKSSILVHPNWTNGPFRATLSQNLPDTFILTKTHCGSRCVHCAPDGYLETQRTFQRSCQTGKRVTNGTGTEVIYDSSILKGGKAVHLIRNPLDNIVARFHLSRRHEKDDADGIAAFFANNATGFQAWCTRLDTLYLQYESHTPWLDAPLRKLWKDVPCHAEFFKYAQWHNLALWTAESMDLEVHLLRYEDYDDDNWHRTVESLLTFLQLPAVAWDDATPFESRSYHSYYTKVQVANIEALLKDVASAPIWDIVGDYFHNKEI